MYFRSGQARSGQVRSDERGYKSLPYLGTIFFTEAMDRDGCDPTRVSKYFLEWANLPVFWRTQLASLERDGRNSPVADTLPSTLALFSPPVFISIFLFSPSSSSSMISSTVKRKMSPLTARAANAEKIGCRLPT